MKITITAHIDISEIPRKYKYMSIAKSGTVSLWENEPKQRGGFWEYNDTSGKYIGFLEVSDIVFEPCIFKLDDEAAA